MSEAEQDQTPQRTEDEWVELEEELAEIRKKRDQLDAQNRRVTDNLRRTTEERDKAKAQLEECCEDRSRLNGSANRMIEALQGDVRQMTAERDAIKEVIGSASRMVQALERDVSQLQVERDAVSKQLAQTKEAADMFEQENKYLQDTIQQLRTKQVHGDLPGLLMSIQLAAEQARLLI
jgi:uncharacterized coiled-coil DUF342 family protein